MILTVHDGKGQKDRTVPLPASILDELRAQVDRVHNLHEIDLKSGYHGTFMFGAFEKKSPTAAKEFIWQWDDGRRGGGGTWGLSTSLKLF